MKTNRDILAELWALAGGDPSVLGSITLSGAESVLPSSFRVDTAAQVTIAAAGLAAASIWQARSGRMQNVAVDLQHAAIECRSERYLRVDGKPPPPAWDAIAGVYTTGDGRFVRLHTNFPHHRDAVCKVLACKPERDDVQRALMQWQGEAFETAAYAGGCVVSLMRSHDEWSATGQAQALASLPVLTIEKIGEADPRPWPAGDRPLSGLRVLDLSRVIAGPVAGRTLAAHGADVMLMSSPKLPAIPWLVIDTGRGKLSASADLTTEEGRATLRGLLAESDVFSQGYRPQGLAALGFSPEQVAQASPGIVYVSLSAYGHVGPWSRRRGFDSLVQTAAGFNHAEGVAAGTTGPKELPMQILDHASGYLMAFGAMMARLRQSREGGSWHVRVSLAQTGRWQWDLGRLPQGLATADLTSEAIRPVVEEAESGFGRLVAVRHSAILSQTPAAWSRPAVPLGSSPPQWPTRG
ncbi:CoA transferase [Bradyrhizobium prioriisuperbiae]|uniref:CoA transferase n=1 Tax=Bradyrhizobium prioriisuperbiae TaxID=2854389 RepID=UPI0028E7AE2E|nr:CoA transferase [Bradyrhizobium prioritasuperba]